MSIRQRVIEAEILWKSNQKEGAWIQALIATAATARKRYPEPIKDNQAFKKYIRDISYTIFTGRPKPLNLQNGEVVFNFSGRPFEDILYKEYRCSLIHEADLGSVGLSKSKIEGNKLYCRVVVGEHTELPDHWVLNLLNAVRWSPENADEFNDK